MWKHKKIISTANVFLSNQSCMFSLVRYLNHIILSKLRRALKLIKCLSYTQFNALQADTKKIIWYLTMNVWYRDHRIYCLHFTILLFLYRCWNLFYFSLYLIKCPSYSDIFYIQTLLSNKNSTFLNGDKFYYVTKIKS